MLFPFSFWYSKVSLRTCGLFHMCGLIVIGSTLLHYEHVVQFTAAKPAIKHLQRHCSAEQLCRQFTKNYQTSVIAARSRGWTRFGFRGRSTLGPIGALFSGIINAFLAIEIFTVKLIKEKEKEYLKTSDRKIVTGLCEDVLRMLEVAQLYNALRLCNWCLHFLCVHYNEACRNVSKLIKVVTLLRLQILLVRLLKLFGLFVSLQNVAYMGVERIFAWRALGDFSNIFLGRQKWWNLFFPTRN